MNLKPLLAVLSICCTTSVPAWADGWDYQNLFKAIMALDQNESDYEQFADEYMQAFAPKLWQQAQQDEFARHDADAEEMAIMDDTKNSFDTKKIISVYYIVQYRDYDFSHNEFHFYGDPLSVSLDDPTNYLYISCDQNNELPDIRVYMSMNKLVMPMNEQTAREFVDQQENAGNTNKLVQVEIDFVPTSARFDNNKYLFDLYADFRKFVVYDRVSGNTIYQYETDNQ